MRGVDGASVDNAASIAGAELMALAETFSNISSDELTNGTKIYHKSDKCRRYTRT